MVEVWLVELRFIAGAAEQFEVGGYSFGPASEVVLSDGEDEYEVVEVAVSDGNGSLSRTFLFGLEGDDHAAFRVLDARADVGTNVLEDADVKYPAGLGDNILFLEQLAGFTAGTINLYWSAPLNAIRADYRTDWSTCAYVIMPTNPKG